jgi:hypothetical protein
VCLREREREGFDGSLILGGGEFDFTLNLCGKKNPRERFLERERTLHKDSRF